MTPPLDIVFIGLTLSSSWGNGHATTYRALLRGLADEGHRVLFLERDRPWYAQHRDLASPDFCDFALYDSPEELLHRHAARLRQADAVIVGSYLPDGRRIIDALSRLRPRMLCYYDIDTPVTMDLLRQGEETHLAAAQIPLFDIYLSFSGGGVLSYLQQRHGARQAEALYCSVDTAGYAGTPDLPIRWDLGYLGTYSDDRQPGLEALLLEPARHLPQMRFVVAGSQYPDDIDWPANVERIEHLPPDRHAAFYRAQRFTLNVTRAAMRQMGWSPSVRLFEAAAAGTPVISDDWPGLTELFPKDRAILIAQGGGDVIAALTRLDDDRRHFIGQSARTIVRARHTGRARARELGKLLIGHRAATPAVTT